MTKDSSKNQDSRWTPVSEGLPKKNGKYIVTEKEFSLNDKSHTGRFHRTTDAVEFYNGKWQRAKFYEVVAWMPFPDSYREESTDGSSN